MLQGGAVQCSEPREHLLVDSFVEQRCSRNVLGVFRSNVGSESVSWSMHGAVVTLFSTALSMRAAEQSSVDGVWT